MRIGKELLVILYVMIFLINDPQVVCASRMHGQSISDGLLENANYKIDPFLGMDDSAFHIAYVLNGGMNHSENLETLYAENLPMTLEVPIREGYNFAGWYTDSSYTHKVTEINRDNASNMLLFAKWTKSIDNYYNVEMYSYQTENMVSHNQKKLSECTYDFLENLKIPGMPSTREQDYLDNYIAAESQCLQGMCFTPDYILITAYTETDKEPGSLMIFDRESGEFLVTLEMKKDSHLGGIAYDGENIWVCHSSSNTLERISYEYIRLIAENAAGYCVDASAISDEYELSNIPSCITCYGGRIWVATYSKFFESKMVSYSYDVTTDRLVSLSSYNIPKRVQGIAFDRNGSVYLSTSLGRNNSSYLKVYDSLLALTKNPGNPKVKIEMPPCSEEIVVAEENVYILFESASEKYFEGTDGKGTSTSPIDQVLEVEVASIW